MVEWKKLGDLSEIVPAQSDLQSDCIEYKPL